MIVSVGSTIVPSCRIPLLSMFTVMGDNAYYLSDIEYFIANENRCDKKNLVFNYVKMLLYLHGINQHVFTQLKARQIKSLTTRHSKII